MLLAGNWLLWLLIGKNSALPHSLGFLVCNRLGLCALCTCPALSTAERRARRETEWKKESQRGEEEKAVTLHTVTHARFCLSQQKKVLLPLSCHPHCTTLSCSHRIIKTQGCLCVCALKCVSIQGCVPFFTPTFGQKPLLEQLFTLFPCCHPFHHFFQSPLFNLHPLPYMYAN